MNRRHFVKISAATTVGILFNRITSLAEGFAPVMNLPDEVWAQSGKDWIQLKSSGSAYT
jgi:alpha-galactosidase